MGWTAGFSFWMTRWLVVAALSMGADAPPSEPSAPAPAAAIEPQDLSADYGPAAGVALATTGPDRLALGWWVEEGASAGVYILNRRAGAWDDMPTPLDGGGRPRDLALAFDDAGGIHAVWTGLEGERRRVYCAALPSESRPGQPPRVVNPDDNADADYPLLALDPRFGYIIVWQSARMTNFAIESAVVELLGRYVTRLPPVSGASGAAMTPQTLSASPATIAWYEIQDSATRLRASRFNPLSGEVWLPADLPAPPQGLPMRQQPIAQLDPQAGLLLCWSDTAAGGLRLERVGGAGPGSLSVGEGQARQPQLQSVGRGLFTLSWQSAWPGGQAVDLALIDAAEAGPIALRQVRRVAPASQGFPADPSHASAGDWTAIAWVDDAREGGSGRVEFAEARWETK